MIGENFLSRSLSLGSPVLLLFFPRQAGEECFAGLVKAGVLFGQPETKGVVLVPGPFAAKEDHRERTAPRENGEPRLASKPCNRGRSRPGDGSQRVGELRAAVLAEGAKGG